MLLLGALAVKGISVGGGHGEALGALGFSHGCDLIDLGRVEAGHLAELPGELDGCLAGFTAGPAVVEQSVDGALELECLLLAIGVVLRNLAQPIRAHFHVGHFVGEHPVLGVVQHVVVHLDGEIAHGGEHVDGQTLECPVHAGEAEHRVGMAGGLEQGNGFAELTDVGAHVVAEFQTDLHMAGFIPALAGHVELHGERCFVGGVVERSAASALERLDLAHEDAVHLPTGAVGAFGTRRVHATLFAATVGALVGEPVGGGDAIEPCIAGQGFGRQLGAHKTSVPLLRGRHAAEDTKGRVHNGGVRVAYTLEQCWHRVPGGTAMAAIRVAAALAEHGDVQLIGVAGRHRHLPDDPWTPPIPTAHLPLATPWLYETWLRAKWPKVERATGKVDVTHATGLIPCPTDAPLVATLHDLAFLHTPEHFTRHGNRVFRDSLGVIKRTADLVLCSSQATLDDVAAVGIGADRLRLVPLGVDVQQADRADVTRVRSLYRLPERYLLFVGTLEPRKNLARLVAAVARLDDPVPLVVVGADGWGDLELPPNVDTRFVGFVPEEDLGPLYAGAEAFCYPSEREGYGLPVLEAMAQGTPVVTSAGTATEETAGGAGVLVDPLDIDDIARGISDALTRRAELAARGLARAKRLTWAATASLTAAAYRELAR